MKNSLNGRKHINGYMAIVATLATLVATSPVAALTPTSSGLNLTGLTPELAGLKIATAAREKDRGYGNTEAPMVMTLIDKNGNKSVRNMRNKSLEVKGDGDKSLSIFDEPVDVKGVTMLTFSHGVAADDQWLYLPTLKRVKRISSNSKSGPFMGSEFSFEDLSSPEVEKYKYKLLGEDTVSGLPCYKMELIPQYADSGYSKEISWVDKAELRNMKIEYYDRKNSLLKKLNSSDFRQYKNKYWRGHMMMMTNVQTGKGTELKWGTYKFNSDTVHASDFSSNALASGQ